MVFKANQTMNSPTLPPFLTRSWSSLFVEGSPFVIRGHEESGQSNKFTKYPGGQYY